jgi:hypothetical protein
MRKFWVLVGMALVVGGAGAGISYLAAERAALVHAELAQALQQMETVTVLSDRFEQGVVASSAEIHIEVDGVAGAWLQGQFDLAGLENARARFGLRLNVELRHSPDIAWNWLMDGAVGEPVVAVAVSALALDQETARDFSTALGELTPITFVSEVRMTGAHQTSVVWEPADFENQSETAPWTVNWRGLDGLLVRAGNGSLDGHLTGAGFDWKGANGSLAVGGFDLEINGRADAEGRWNGDIEQRWRDVVWTPAQPTEGDGEELPASEENAGHWAASDLRIDHRSVPDSGDNEWRVDLRAATGAINGAPMDSALMSLRLRHPAASETAASAEGLQLLVPGLAMDPIQLEIQGTRGSLSLAGRLSVDPDPLGSDDSIDPLTAFDRFVGELEIDAKGDILSEVGVEPEMLMAWVEAGLATVTETGAVAHFSLKHGEFGEPEAVPAAADEIEAVLSEAEGSTTMPVETAEAEATADPNHTDLEEAAKAEPAGPVVHVELPVEPEPADADVVATAAPKMPAVPASIPDSPPAAQLEDIAPLPAVEIEAVEPAPMPKAPRRGRDKRAEATEDALLREMIADSDSEAAPEASTQR